MQIQFAALRALFVPSGIDVVGASFRTHWFSGFSVGWDRNVGWDRMLAGIAPLCARRLPSGFDVVVAWFWVDRFIRFRLLVAQIRFAALRARRVPPGTEDVVVTFRTHRFSRVSPFATLVGMATLCAWRFPSVIEDVSVFGYIDSLLFRFCFLPCSMDSKLSVLDVFHPESTLVAIGFGRTDSTVSAFSHCWLGSLLSDSVLDVFHLGSTFSVRELRQIGSAVSVLSQRSFGSLLSLLDVLHLGST